MLDPKHIRSQTDAVRRGLALKGAEGGLDAFLALDEQRRQIQTEADDLRAKRNAVSEEIGRMKRAAAQGGTATAVDEERMKSEMREVGTRIAELEVRLAGLEEEQQKLADWFPNVPHESVPEGDASKNQPQKAWGTPRDPKGVLPHWEIGAKLGLLDFERGGKIAGSGFLLFTGQGARLERALIQFFLDTHVSKNGYVEVSPPHMVRPECLYGTGQLPKLAQDMYHLADDNLYMNPTAEVPVTNIYREEILPAEMLPHKVTAYCPSFRREAGAAGKDTRGMVRVHQFDKVEMVRFVMPETSYEHLEQLTGDAERLLEALELPYKRVLLASGDMSFASAKTYDLEAWAPAEGRWLEVSSCSNFEAFQARRMNIRFRRDAKSKPEFVHTLNGSGLALPRIVVCILENHQTDDGRVKIPAALRPYMGGLEFLG